MFFCRGLAQPSFISLRLSKDDLPGEFRDKHLRRILEAEFDLGPGVGVEAHQRWAKVLVVGLALSWAASTGLRARVQDHVVLFIEPEILRTASLVDPGLA